MPLSADNYLKCLSDAFTPVRSADGRLLGCIPRVADDAVMAGPFPLMIGAQVCVVVDLNALGTPPVTALPNFVALDDADTDLALPVGGDDPDLAEGV